MTNSNVAKRFWQAYSTLKRWSETDEGKRIFRVESCSMDEGSEIDFPSAGAASSGIPENLVILGGVFPSTAPFQNQALPIEIQVSYKYPFQPPLVYLKIKLRHPNVDKDGT